ncbi:hypothetical protein LCGC14_1665110, partial [marine sediment metagenome]
SDRRVRTKLADEMRELRDRLFVLSSGILADVRGDVTVASWIDAVTSDLTLSADRVEALERKFDEALAVVANSVSDNCVDEIEAVLYARIFVLEKALEEALQKIAWSSPWTAPSQEEAQRSQEIARELLEERKAGVESLSSLVEKIASSHRPPKTRAEIKAWAAKIAADVSGAND